MGRFSWPLQIGAPDSRSREQLELDLDDELSFHVDQLQREFEEAGHDAGTARHRALDRFGDVTIIKTACRRVALKEHVMLQRLNAFVLIIVLLALIAVAVQLYLTQRDTGVALTEISARITELRDANMEGPTGGLRAELSHARNEVAAAQSRAEQEAERSRAVTSFLQDMLTNADPSVTDDVQVDDVLDAARARVDTQFDDQPEVAARLRETIAQTRARLGEDGVDRPRESGPTVEDLLPVPFAYRVRGGDELTVEIFELYQPGQWASFTLQVRADGTVMAPEVGPITVAGKPIEAVQELIVTRLTEVMVAPLVTLSLAGGGHEFSVHGAAGRPGVYPLDRPNVRLLEALASAGGALEGTRQIRIVRRVDTPDDLLVGATLLATRTIVIDYERLSYGDPIMDVLIRPYDRLFIVRPTDAPPATAASRTDERADADR